MFYWRFLPEINTMCALVVLCWCWVGDLILEFYFLIYCLCFFWPFLQSTSFAPSRLMNGWGRFLLVDAKADPPCISVRRHSHIARQDASSRRSAKYTWQWISTLKQKLRGSLSDTLPKVQSPPEHSNRSLGMWDWGGGHAKLHIMHW